MEPIIEFKDFNFKYRSQKEPTLKNINLAIYPGEKVLIVGPSGSGKSTLAHCINGLVPFFYTGEITGTYQVGGKDPAKLGIFGLSKLVGTVLQDTDGQFIGLTVAEDILLKEGIREPLYVTALKYAGCRITEKSGPADIRSMQLTEYAPKVREWVQRFEVQEKTPDAEAVLEVRNMAFAYQENRPVLQDISFTVHKGEMLSIVGKNGAGKSTLSNLICGFITPNEGAIYWHGEDLSALSIKERGEHIGLVMQNPNQMISKPMIFDEVALGLQVRGVPKEEIKERVEETLRICGLYPFRNWPISALSYGQKKRVTIASILVMNPDIIILDEPTAGQDYRHYTEIMEFLKSINELHGITIIMITHDMHLMLEYTDRAIVIADGKLLADTKPSEVLTDDVLTEKAYLKRTSLYDLAVGCDAGVPSEFVECFIRYEREHRFGTKGE